MDLMLKSLSWRPLRLLLEGLGHKDKVILVREYLSFAAQLKMSYGWTQTVKILKDLNSKGKLAALGYPQNSRSLGGIWFKTDSNGIPRVLKGIRETLSSGSPESALIVLNLVYLCRTPPSTDISSITSAYTGTWSESDTTSFQSYLKRCCPRLKASTVPYHLSLKAGPNGSPASLTASLDVLASSISPGSDWQFKHWCKELGNTDLLRLYENQQADLINPDIDISKLNYPKDTLKLAKIALLSDKSGKTRQIYILDWWRQQLLLPIHDAMMLWFKTQRQDATWDQNGKVTEIMSWTKQGKTLYSFDLTSATDRWPIWHQRMVIQSAFGSIWGEVWHDCLSTTKPYFPEIGKWISYEVGQPMGAYSSWPALNITHHLTIRWIADKLGCEPDYMVLGDDIVIANDILAQGYIEVLDKLGVTISKSKSVICKDGGPSSAEFAKHLLKDGKNLTPVSPSLLKEIYEDWNIPKFIDLLREISVTQGNQVIVQEGNIWLSPLVCRLLEPLKRYKDDILVILSSPLVGGALPTKRDHTSVLPAEYVSFPNPWAGKMEFVLLSLQRDLIVENLMKVANQLIELRSQLQKGDSLSILPGYLLERKSHIIWTLLEALDQEIQSTCAVLAQGESCDSNHARLAVDSELLLDLLVHGKDFDQWKALKELRLKKAVSMILKVYRQSANPQGSMNDIWGDASYDDLWS
jgi:hypothetical protein